MKLIIQIKNRKGRKNRLGSEQKYQYEQGKN